MFFLVRDRVRAELDDDLARLRVKGATGTLVPLSELGRWVSRQVDQTIYHKNLLPVIYITGDVVGRQESPVYAILKMNQALRENNKAVIEE